MPEQSTTTRALTIAEIKKALSELGEEIDRTKTRVVAEKSGVPVAALVSIDDLERLQHRDRVREENFKAIERFGAAFADVPPEEAEAEIARIIAEIRQQDNAEAERQTAWRLLSGYEQIGPQIHPRGAERWHGTTSGTWRSRRLLRTTFGIATRSPLS